MQFRPLLALTALLGLSAPARGVVLSIAPSNQDGYVRQNTPLQVFSGRDVNSRIRVSSSRLVSSPLVRRGLVQFDLSVIPSGSEIHSAFLELHEESGALDAPRIHGAYRVREPWSEGTVAWGTQPAHADTPTATAEVGTGRRVRRFDVTADVVAFGAQPTSNHGWMILDQAETSGRDDVAYASREARDVPASHRPRLVLDFAPHLCTVDANCGDTNACTVHERCEHGFCFVDAATCDDHSLCTDDICDPGRGCVFTPINCNDGFSCTADTCDPGAGCVHTTVPTVCPSDACRATSCTADPDDPTVDSATGCQVTSVAADGSACPADANQCTTDTCSAGRCTHPPAPGGAPCSDGNACTQGDTCDGAGRCVLGPSKRCQALDQCHDVGTCDPATGRCSDPPTSPGATCNDGNPCTLADRCNGQGVCAADGVLTCDAPDQCHQAGTCDVRTGRCTTPAKSDGTPCDDGDPCTSDACIAGACSGTPVPDGAACTDGNPCNGEEQCRAGSCGPPPDESLLCLRASVVAGVTNFRDGSLSLIDTTSLELLATVGVGEGAWAVAVRPDGRELWVTNRKAGTVSVVDTANRAVVATIQVAPVPEGIVFDRDGTRAYVASYADDVVQVIDTTTRTIVDSIRVGRGPTALVLDHDTATLYVVNFAANSVSAVDTLTGRIVATVATGARPVHAALDRRRGRLYVTNFRSGTVSVIGTVSKTVLATLSVGPKPFAVAVDTIRARAVVTNAGNDTVSVIDTAANVVLATLGVGRGPLGVGIDLAGRAFVADSKSAQVTVVDVGSGTIIATLDVGQVPVAAGEFVASVAIGCPKQALVCDDKNVGTLDLCEPATGCSHIEINSFRALGPLLSALDTAVASAAPGAFSDPALVRTLVERLRATRALFTGGATGTNLRAMSRQLARFTRAVERGLRRTTVDRDLALRLLDLARRGRVVVGRSAAS